jgi:hypothetical protein
MTGEIAPISKRMGNSSVVSNGYQYRIHGENSELITGCVKNKCGTCKRKLQTKSQYEILSKADLSCLPNLAGIEVTVKLENCRKSYRTMSVPVHAIYKKEFPLCGRI